MFRESPSGLASEDLCSIVDRRENSTGVQKRKDQHFPYDSSPMQEVLSVDEEYLGSP